MRQARLEKDEALFPLLQALFEEMPVYPDSLFRRLEGCLQTLKFELAGRGQLEDIDFEDPSAHWGDHIDSRTRLAHSLRLLHMLCFLYRRAFKGFLGRNPDSSIGKFVSKRMSRGLIREEIKLIGKRGIEKQAKIPRRVIGQHADNARRHGKVSLRLGKTKAGGCRAPAFAFAFRLALADQAAQARQQQGIGQHHRHQLARARPQGLQTPLRRGDTVKEEHRHFCVEPRGMQRGQGLFRMFAVQPADYQIGQTGKSRRCLFRACHGGYVVMRRLKNRRKANTVGWQRVDDKKRLGHRVAFVLISVSEFIDFS